MQHSMMDRPAPTTAVPLWFDQLADRVAEAVVARVQRRLEDDKKRLEKQPTRSPYATVEEAATFLRCKPQRVYDLVSSQVLRKHKDGARVLILWSDLELHVTAAERIRAGARRVNGYA